eukprot:scpid103577/ scgid24188/ 
MPCCQCTVIGKCARCSCKTSHTVCIDCYPSRNTPSTCRNRGTASPADDSSRPAGDNSSQGAGHPTSVVSQPSGCALHVPVVAASSVPSANRGVDPTANWHSQPPAWTRRTYPRTHPRSDDDHSAPDPGPPARLSSSTRAVPVLAEASSVSLIDMEMVSGDGPA